MHHRLRNLTIAASTAALVLAAMDVDPTLAQTPASGRRGAQQAPNVERELAHGRTAFERRDPATAYRHFETVLHVDSLNYEASWRAALALVTLGQATPDSVRSPERDTLYARAERLARHAVQLNRGKADGWFVLATTLGRTALTKSPEEQARLAVAIRDAARKAIELNPKHDGAYHVLGRWHAEIMRLPTVSRFVARQFLGADAFDEASWEGALQNLEQAVKLDPKRIVHRLELARLYVDRKRYADARAQLETLAGLPIRDYLDPQYKEDAAALFQRIANRPDGS